MGIHDRPYMREEGGFGPRRGLGGRGGGGLGRLTMLSVNTWIIVLCIAIFVIDGMMPSKYVASGRAMVPDGQPIDWSQVEPDFDSAVEFRPGPTGGRPPVEGARPFMWYVPMLDISTGTHVATGEYYQMQPIEAMLHFSTARGLGISEQGISIYNMEFWRLIGFQFLHSHLHIGHLLFNMIGLFFFGPLVERYLGSKRYLAFYLLCGIFGALLYVTLNVGGLIAQNVASGQVAVPGLLFNDPSTPLIGASAGVFGVLMAGAKLAPNATVLLFFIIPMKFKYLAYGLVAFALWIVITGGRNAGGEAGHLGGALAGWYFIRNTHHLHGFFDFLGRADPTSHHYRGKKSIGSGGGGGAPRQEVDRILDKISREGLHALSDREKKILREASRDR